MNGLSPVLVVTTLRIHFLWRCGDGTYSFIKTHVGTCWGHYGVAASQR